MSVLSKRILWCILFFRFLFQISVIKQFRELTNRPSYNSLYTAFFAIIYVSRNRLWVLGRTASVRRVLMYVYNLCFEQIQRERTKKMAF